MDLLVNFKKLYEIAMLGNYTWKLFSFYFLLFAIAYHCPAGANLEYEFSTASILLTVFFVPIAGLYFSRPRELMFGASLGFLAYMMIGELFFFTNYCSCSIEGYRFWMGFNLLPAWFMAHGLALGYGRVKAKIGNLRLTLLHVSLLAIWFFFDALTLWFFPQKRLTSLFFGHLHGPIYDEFIPLDADIFLLRGMHFAIFLLLIAITAFVKTKRQLLTSLSLLALFLLAEVFFRQSRPSLAFGVSSLRQKLSEQRKGEGYELYFPSEVAKEKNLVLFEQELRFHLSELRAFFSKDVPLVQVYVYRDEEQKKLLFGAGSTDVTDIVTPSIHLQLTKWPHPSLRHELVHALSSKWAYFGLGFHPNMAFTEGLAVSLEYQDRPYSLHEAAAFILFNEKTFEVSELLSPLFWLESAPEAYTVAGSLLSYIRDHYGLKKVLAIYGGTTVAEAISIDEAVLKSEYLTFLQSKINDQASLYFKSRFKNEGVFARVCPHSLADYEQENGYWLSLRRPAGWLPKSDFNAWYRKLDPQNTYALYLELSAKARGEKDKKQVLASMEPYLEKWESDLNITKLLLLKSDLLASTMPVESQAIIEKLLLLSKKKILPEALHRSLYLRTMLTKPALMPWRQYLAGLGQKPAFHIKDKPSFALSYLELVNQVTKLSKEQLLYFHSFTLDANLDKLLQKNWHKNLAIAALYLEQKEIALEHINTISLMGISDSEAEYLVFLAKFMLSVS